MQRARSPEVISKDADSSQTLSCHENMKEREGGVRERERERERERDRHGVERRGEQRLEIERIEERERREDTGHSTHYVVSLVQYHHSPLYVHSVHAPRLQGTNNTVGV